ASPEGGRSQLWLRPIDESSAQPLPGTEGASYPFWSPDSGSVAFFADNKLKRLDIGGGTPRVLVTSTTGQRSGTWNSDGVILIPTVAGRLRRISATGTTQDAVSMVTKLAPGASGQHFPFFLPDGRRFLFLSRGTGDAGGVFLG